MVETKFRTEEPEEQLFKRVVIWVESRPGVWKCHQYCQLPQLLGTTGHLQKKKAHKEDVADTTYGP